ncbi:MAG TPA: bifunctional oligoribonuclease/PAP phosphatase NrnA [Mycobacteriales bacterium]|nr:bifunctional oligoribonuclease/PAP phosphatase NrnA [Mycobacteriales bacterium]
MIAESAWDAAVAALSTAGAVTVACHIHPDGDALGSVLALGQALRNRGTRVTVSFSEPYVVPAQLRILPGQDLLVPPADVPNENEVFVAVDTASAQRLGTLRERAESAARLIVLDHHASNSGFGDVLLLDTDAAAAGLVVAELIDRLRIPYDSGIAACLYAAIASDTGSFRFGNTTPDTHLLAARLLSVGFPHDELNRSLFDTRPAGWLRMLAGALDRAVIEPFALAGVGLVWTAVTAADLARDGLPFDQAESVIDVLRTTENAGVAAVFKEQSPGVWIVSTRSRGRWDVATACTALGGGGHRFAAGYTAYGELPAVVAQLRAALDGTESAAAG